MEYGDNNKHGDCTLIIARNLSLELYEYEEGGKLTLIDRQEIRYIICLDVHPAKEQLMIGDWDFNSHLSDVKIYDIPTKTWDGPKVQIREGNTWEQFRMAYWIDQGRRAITSVFGGDNTCYETTTWSKLFVI